MLAKKLWRTMGLYRAQFISMILMIALGIGIFVGFNMEWVSIKTNTEHFFSETGFADYRIVAKEGFSKEELAKIKALNGVDEAALYLSVSADLQGVAGRAVALCVTTDPKVSGILVTEGAPYDGEDAQGLWLSDKFAKANSISVGDELTLVYQNKKLRGTVRGLGKSGEQLICVRDESQLMPDYETYGFCYAAPALYEEALGMAYYPQINVISTAQKGAFSDAVDKALSKTTLILTKEETPSYAQADGEATEGKTMGAILPTLFLLIAVLTMVTTMHRVAAREKTQIGTLKALGFRDGTILRHYTSYALLVGCLGTVLGILLGYGIAYAVMNPSGMMGTYLDMPYWELRMPLFCILCMLGILALLTLIGYLSVRTMLRGTAADALRPYTPKKIRPMLIERTKWFHRLSFGTRWNLRDVTRHKARTAMSLIGIAGCTVLIVGTLGMNDTMHSFLSLYYDGATNYQRRIYLSESADDGAVQALKERYDTDASQSISVQLAEKAVSLDIYEIRHDLIRFPDKTNQYISLAQDGAYVCMRLAEELGVKAGDSITVSPYGSFEEYTLHIAGVVRSVSENIVISRAYAKTLGIADAPDSLYTKTEKTEIAADDAIKTVQSKQAIVDSFDTFMDLMNLMIAIMVVGALVLGIIVLYNLGVMSYTERYREMATLKVVGFRDARIGALLVQQNLWLSLIGVLLGIPGGAGALWYLLKKLAGEFEMKMAISPWSILIAVALTVGMSLLVSLLVARKNRKIDMVEALKGAE